jgi:alkanesulfonate monooxygenase SsuD/methylene tetrahydromethanopterin reductase-like flavin-dependent oxidoreductase (luciferase family)
VLLQAGSSGRGRDFAAKWAELIFTGDPGIDVARSHYKDQKERIAELGRDPGAVKMLPMAYAVVGESKAHAEEREQLFLNDLVHPMASLTLLSELMNHDFSGLALDAPITDELIESVSGIRGLVQNIRKHIGGDTVTLADLAGHRATLLQGPRFVGTGPEVADQMEEWFDSGACDGFVLAATHCPGAYEDVVRLVVPELQRRGVFRDRYTGRTLRDHLGLARPECVPHG